MKPGRPPALSPAQQQEVQRRLAAGETVSALAAEFGVGRATIRQFSTVSATVRKVAEKVAAAQAELEALPPAQQHQVLSLADRLRKVSDSLADAAVAGADTSRHLHALANAAARKINAETFKTAGEDLRAVAALTKMANEAAAVPIGLMSASKSGARLPGDDADEGLPTVVELIGPPDVPSAAASSA